MALKEDIVKKSGKGGIVIVHQRTSLKGSNFDQIKLSYVRGNLRPDRGSSGGGVKGQVTGSPHQHHSSISARSRIRLPFDWREHQDRDER